MDVGDHIARVGALGMRRLQKRSPITLDGGGVGGFFFGFSFGVGPRLVGDMMDISTAGGDNLNTMLRVIRHDSDAAIAREIIDDVNVAVRKYADKEGEVHRQMREPLQMDRIVIESEPIRQRVQRALTQGEEPLVRYSLATDPVSGRLVYEKGSLVLGDVIEGKFFL